MHVLVTGGAGFIGSFLCERLIAEGCRVRVFDNLDPQVHFGGAPSYLSPAAEMCVGDVRDRAACAAAIEGVDAVVHCAAAVGVAQSLYRIEHYADVNVRGTAALLQCLAEHHAAIRKLVVLSSMTSYGEGAYRRPSDGRVIRVGIRSEEQIQRWGWEPVDPTTGETLEQIPTTEDAALLAQNVYALTKRSQEDLALSLGAVYQFPVVCLRMFNVYGPRQSLSNPYTGVLAIFLSRVLSGQPPVVYEDGNQSRDFVSVHDVVDAIFTALVCPTGAGEIINIGSGVPRRIGETARLVAILARAPVEPIITQQFRRGDVRHCTADIDRAKQFLGFEPRMTFEDGVAELLEWSRSAPAVDHFANADRELRSHGLLTGRMSVGGSMERA